MLRDVLLKAYRWQYIVSGVQEPRFGEVLKALVTPAQMERIGKALAPISRTSAIEREETRHAASAATSSRVVAFECQFGTAMGTSGRGVGAALFACAPSSSTATASEWHGAVMRR